MRANPGLERHSQKDVNVPLWGWPKGERLFSSSSFDADMYILPSEKLVS